MQCPAREARLTLAAAARRPPRVCHCPPVRVPTRPPQRALPHHSPNTLRHWTLRRRALEALECPAWTPLPTAPPSANNDADALRTSTTAKTSTLSPVRSTRRCADCFEEHMRRVAAAAYGVYFTCIPLRTRQTEHRFSEEVRRRGLEIKPMQTDGACLFRSIGNSLLSSVLFPLRLVTTCECTLWL